MKLTNDFEARMLVAKQSHIGRIEVYVIHHAGDPGNSIAQVDLFYNRGRWHAWTGHIIRDNVRVLCEMVAARRNEVQS